MPKTSKCKRTYAEDNTSITFTFADGRVLVVEMAEIPSHLYPRLAIRGVSENLSNAGANAKTVDEFYEAASAMYETYKKGLLTERVPSEREDPVETLAEAYSRFKVANGAAAPDRAKLLARLNAMAKAERDTLRRTPSIAAIIAEIKAEKRPVTVTPDALVGEL